jgi:large subunit ribosomal protein L4
MKTNIYNQKGEVLKEIKLPKECFGVEFNEVLVHRALIRQLSNTRNPIAHTKTKGEVRGGGRKPYRQKGTGRARQGSTRNPHFVGGGVAFGPRNDKNFYIQMPKKQRRKALLCALSQKATEKSVIALDKYEDKELKTKNLAATIAKLPIERNVLLVTSQKDENLNRVASNLKNVKVITTPYLNIHDLTKYRTICFVGEDSIQLVADTFKI